MLGHTMIIHLGPRLQLLDGLQRNPGLQKKFNSWIFIETYSNPMDWTKNQILAGWHQDRIIGVLFLDMGVIFLDMGVHMLSIW